LIHGLLHLAGFDHEGVEEEVVAEMREAEEVIYKEVCG
jgi:ssRNA-specific RNase YbeY (16S rRNA maturation enzyme)